MKRIIFLSIILCAALCSWAHTPEQPVRILSNWVTYDRTSAPEWAAECPSYVLQLASDGTAYLNAQADGEILQAVSGTWTADGRRITFRDLQICDAYTGRVVSYKSAKVKDGEGGPYLVARTTGGTRIFLNL